MSDPIEPSEFEAVARLAASVELTDVRPTAFSARMIGPAPREGHRMRIEVRPALTWQRIQSTFDVIVNFVLYASPEGEPERRFVQMSYRVMARYEWSDGSEPTERTLHQFAHSNAMVNLWPYFRAHVTNTWAQLGLAPFVLPVFRLKAWKPEPEPPGGKLEAGPRKRR